MIYVDDGSGAVDGRESQAGLPVPGIRILVDSADPELVVPNYGDFVMVEGIAAYEPAPLGAYATVRQILFPKLTIIAPVGTY